jgi:spermidine/putrescine transport system ATP-binding protein
MTKRFGEVVALDGVSVSVQTGEFFALLGPSGCGKTTLLRIIAGLEWPDAGTLRLSGEDALPLPAHRRHVNTVFQSYALFPHLTVRENVAFGLRMKKVPAADLDRRTASALDLAQVSGLASRMPAQLSGGQKQRVALARAVVNEPRVLLLDEPLGALDLKLRRNLQAELRALQRRLGITFIHVTHDQEEALALSNRVAVMNSGRIEQLGSGRELYERPRSRFVAQFLGACNVLDATVTARDAHHTHVSTPFGPLRVRVEAQPDTEPRSSFALAIRPERVRLRGHGEPAEWNCVRGCVTRVTFTGAATDYEVESNGATLRASVPNSGNAKPTIAPGELVTMELPAEALRVLDA